MAATSMPRIRMTWIFCFIGELSAFSYKLPARARFYLIGEPCQPLSEFRGRSAVPTGLGRCGDVPGAEAPGYWRMSLGDTSWYKQVSYGNKPVCKQVSPPGAREVRL